MVKGGPWIGWGASVQGPGHIMARLPNQDAWTAFHLDAVDAVVVCDGMGSCPEARRGARAACRAIRLASSLLVAWPDMPWEDFLRQAHSLWLALIKPVAPKDCRTTCLCALRHRNKIHLAQLGDGMVAVIGPQGSQTLPDEAKEFSNMTSSLGADFSGTRWRTAILSEDDVDAVVLCSDGIADDLLPDLRTDFARDLVSAYNDLPARQKRRELRQALHQWAAPGHTDDKTLACLQRACGYRQVESVPCR